MFVYIVGLCLCNVVMSEKLKSRLFKSHLRLLAALPRLCACRICILAAERVRIFCNVFLMSHILVVVVQRLTAHLSPFTCAPVLAALRLRAARCADATPRRAACSKFVRLRHAGAAQAP
jgi:hypothetical protein